jgi:NAD(P)H-hydrate epimerase
MENAGRGAALVARQHFGDLAGRNVAVICGRGANGGDGFVMGRVFHGWGARVRFYLLSEIDRVGGDARINLNVAQKMGLEIVEIKQEGQVDRIDLAKADLIVDAILGTGLDSEVRGLYRDTIERINAAGRPVVAVDVPSGLDSDTGRRLGGCVQADLTVTFGLPKAGLLQPPGEQAAGRLEVVDIGIPPHVLAEADPRKELLTEESLAGTLFPRSLDAHKGTYGHVLIVAGSTGKTGAAAMTALAAARSGAGLVTLAVPASLNSIVEEKVTEAMTLPLPEDEPGFLAAEAADLVVEMAGGFSVLALGPGLGTKPGACRLVRELVERCELPLVIDADGLSALSGHTALLRKARREVALTPHPGEMSRLAGLGAGDVQADRLTLAGTFAVDYGTVLALKGYRTVVAAPDGRLYLNTTGGPHMASGGMGDVLTGMIAGLAAQRSSLLDAVRLGVYAHGLAADQVAAAKGPIGLLATDLLDRLPGIWGRFIGRDRDNVRHLST